MQNLLKTYFDASTPGPQIEIGGQCPINFLGALSLAPAPDFFLPFSAVESFPAVSSFEGGRIDRVYPPNKTCQLSGDRGVPKGKPGLVVFSGGSSRAHEPEKRDSGGKSL